MEIRGARHRPAGRVLVAGAGPVGLVVALILRRHGIAVDIVDRNPGPVSQSRATDLHPATLERLGPYGLTRELIDIGQTVRSAVVHAGRTAPVHIPLGRAGSAFPFALTVPQCTTEALIQNHLSEIGTAVERDVRVVDVRPDVDGVDVALQTGTELRHRWYDWVVGCDGAGSTIREALGIEFSGRTSDWVSVVADLELELPYRRDEIHLELRHGGGVHVLPMPVDGYVRVLLDRWPGLVGVPPDADEIVTALGERLGRSSPGATHARWTSSFLMHDRIASRSLQGRVLLMGDAAHVCSPVGGQGLNLGIGDAVALGPALASVMSGIAPRSLLEVVVARRRRAAGRSGALAWWAMGLSSPGSRVLTSARDGLAPFASRLLVPAVTRWLSGAVDR